MPDQHIATREKFRLRIGEIIEATLGVDGVKAIFEAAENGDAVAMAQIEKAQATGFAPSGMLALKLGLVSKEIKDALLTAQAAEKTLLCIERIEHFYQTDVPAMQKLLKDDKSKGNFEDFMFSPHTKTVKDYYMNNIAMDKFEDPSFQYIGSSGDPEMLVSAQATHQLAAQYEQNEKIGMKDEMIDQYMRVPDAVPFGMTYMDGFKACARNSYLQAAKALAEQGHQTLAKDIERLSESITFETENAQKYTPARFGLEAIWQQNKLVTDVNIVLRSDARPDHPYAEVNEDWSKMIKTRTQQVQNCML